MHNCACAHPRRQAEPLVGGNVGRAPERTSDRKCAPGVRREGGSGFIKGLVRLRVEGVTSLREGWERSSK